MKNTSTGMKKFLMAFVLIAAVCLGFFVGISFSNHKQAENRAERVHTFLSLSVDKLEDLQQQYDSDVMEALISDVYAAYQSCDDTVSLAPALHELWNALIFDGENLTGQEEALIHALQDADAQAIADIAYDIRQIS